MAPSSSVFPTRVCSSEHQPSLLFSIYDSPLPSCPQSGVFSGGGGGVHLNRVYFLIETLYLALCIYKSASVFLGIVGFFFPHP